MSHFSDSYREVYGQSLGQMRREMTYTRRAMRHVDDLLKQGQWEDARQIALEISGVWGGITEALEIRAVDEAS